MPLKFLYLLCLSIVLTITQAYAYGALYETTNVKGTIHGAIKKGSLIQMQSGSVYEVTGLTIQVVVEVAPEATVLQDNNEFKVIIKGFDEPLICKQLVPPKATNIPSNNQEIPSPNVAAISKDTTLDNLIPPAEQKQIGIQKLTSVEKERLRVCSINIYLKGLEQGKKAQSASKNVATISQDITLNNLIPPAEQKQMGIQKLTSVEKERLRVCLINTYLKYLEEGKQDQSASNPKVTPQSSTTSTIESNIDGEFKGWDGNTIVKLVNGQIWQQSEYHYNYHYAYSPKVLIYRSGGGYKMKVDGTDALVGVTQIK